MAQIDLHKLDVPQRVGGNVSRVGPKLVTLVLEDEGTELTVFFGGDPAAAHERLKRLRDELDEVAQVLLEQIDPTDHEPVPDPYNLAELRTVCEGITDQIVAAHPGLAR